MRTSLVLTILGDDRPGIVEQLSNQVLAGGANWEESRMARLAGKFAGLLRVSVDASQAEALAARLRAIGGLTVALEPSPQTEPEKVRTLRLELVGNDHPGIVRDIARVLAQQDVNIEELETDVTSAPMSGGALFRARALLRLPSTISSDALVDKLQAVAGELMVDLSVEEPTNARG